MSLQFGGDTDRSGDGRDRSGVIYNEGGRLSSGARRSQEIRLERCGYLVDYKLKSNYSDLSAFISEGRNLRR